MNTVERVTARWAIRQVLAKLEPFDPERVEKLRKDFLILVKNVPHVVDHLKDGDYEPYHEFRGISRDYSANLKQLLFTDFVGTVEHDDVMPEEQAKYLKRKISEAAWDLTGLLWDVIGRDPRGSYRDLEAWDKKVRRLAPAAWKGIKDSIAWYEDFKRKPLVLNVPDRLVMEGFQVEVVGFENISHQYDQVEQFREALRVYKKQALKTLPWLIQHQLPLVLNFHSKLDEGGIYRSGKDIVISGHLYNEPAVRVAKTLAHEMGHHLYNHLGENAQKFWDAAIAGNRGPLNVNDLLSQWPQNIDWSMDFVGAMAAKDPVLALQVDVLAFGHVDRTKYERRSDFESALKEGVTSLTVPKVPISGYADKNPEEAFCEAVGYLVAYGPRAVHDLIRHWLEIVIPGKIKLASAARVAYRYASQGVVLRPVDWKVTSDEAVSVLRGWTRGGHLYRGMSEAEWHFIQSHGVIRSDERDSFKGEGTNFGEDAETAEDYANGGRFDPRKSGKTNYLIEVKKTDDFKRWSDGYWKVPEVPKSLITRAWKMVAEDGAVIAYPVHP